MLPALRGTWSEAGNLNALPNIQSVLIYLGLSFSLTHFFFSFPFSLQTILLGREYHLR